MERNSTFAERLKEYRKITGMTLADIEVATQMPAQTINRYELGQRAPKIDSAVQIAQKLGINPLWLLGYAVEIREKSALTVSDEGLKLDITDLTEENKEKARDYIALLLNSQRK